MIHFWLILGISVASILCMLVRPWGIAEAYWTFGGAALLVALGLLPVKQAGHAVLEGLDVYLFLVGMMILAELAREAGVFDWVADVAAHHAQRSASLLFLLIYVAGTVITALLSNDATAVVLTPAVLAVVRKARVRPKPFVLICALIANAASFVLPISNPANLVIFAKKMPPLAQWLRVFLLPSIASILITFVVLRWLSREALRETIEDLEERTALSSQGRLAFAGLLLSCVALITASLLGWDLGVPTFIAGIVVLVMLAVRDGGIPRKVAASIAWSIVPLVAGLFVIVETLESAGLLGFGQQALAALARAPKLLANLVAAFEVAILSNGMNNLPVGLISGKAIQSAPQVGTLAHSILIGVDLGPNLSVTGSLATILWLIALRREQVEFTAWEFFKVGLVVMPTALLGSILLLTVSGAP